MTGFFGIIYVASRLIVSRNAAATVVGWISETTPTRASCGVERFRLRVTSTKVVFR
jgi:hypothetical protein